MKVGWNSPNWRHSDDWLRALRRITAELVSLFVFLAADRVTFLHKIKAFKTCDFSLFRFVRHRSKWPFSSWAKCFSSRPSQKDFSRNIHTHLANVGWIVCIGNSVGKFVWWALIKTGEMLIFVINQSIHQVHFQMGSCHREMNRYGVRMAPTRTEYWIFAFIAACVNGGEAKNN